MDQTNKTPTQTVDQEKEEEIYLRCDDVLLDEEKNFYLINHGYGEHPKVRENKDVYIISNLYVTIINSLFIQFVEMSL